MQWVSYFFFYICWKLSLSHSESNVKVSYTFKTTKKRKIVYREPHIYNNISRTGKYKYKLWRTLHAMNFTSVHLWIQSFDDMETIVVMTTITLTTNELSWNLLTELALSYVMYWAIWSLINYFKNDNFRTRVIPRHCLNRRSKLTTKKLTYKRYQRR